LEEERNVEIF
jgi:hypothetical protein